ncbi:hypothetical protein [uncultured Methanoregula sp.]|uniref:hypothetical protein n=1 Tax=uncultured Methanoregula sp. TaxID=1005933 RepID=UPI002AAC3003|nr:hypothetical protein [uncultured Methanoregula sp.]
MRNDLEQALFAQNNAGIEQAFQPVHFASINVSAPGRLSRRAGRGHNRPAAVPDPAQDVLDRASRLNTDLRSHGINTIVVEELIFVVGSHITRMRASSVRQMSNQEDPQDHAGLGESVSSLRDTYRRILIREDLPPSVAKEVLAVAQLFDITAGSMGIY